MHQIVTRVIATHRALAYSFGHWLFQIQRDPAMWLKRAIWSNCAIEGEVLM